MMIRFLAARGNAHDGTGQQPIQEAIVMKWETPQAIELRFGMEITMYIANR